MRLTAWYRSWHTGISEPGRIQYPEFCSEAEEHTGEDFMAFLYTDPLTTNPFQNITITNPDQPDKSVPNYQLKENWDNT